MDLITTYKLDDKNNTYVIIPLINFICEVFIERDTFIGFQIHYYNNTLLQMTEYDYRDHYEPGIRDIMKKDMINILKLIDEYWNGKKNF